MNLWEEKQLLWQKWDKQLIIFQSGLLYLMKVLIKRKKT